ncbi:hypothetical protein [Streptomyces sp. NPDC048637]|uniref:hypothetical protein n=1 Tax=Streptomyces sp. NPDC048637 TaxID=3155636 RepID=UPI003432B5F9
MIARAELSEALAVGGDSADATVPEVQAPAPPVAEERKAPSAGSIVPRRGEGMTLQALAPDYRRIVELVESDPGDGEGVSAKEIAARLELELVPAEIEGVRSRMKCLVDRNWLTASPSGRFTPRQPTATARAAAGKPGGRDGGS